MSRATSAASGGVDDQTAEKPTKRALNVLLASAGVSGVGTGVTTVALPLLAASMTDSALEVSLVVFAARLPWLGLAIFSGAIVDRVDRRRLMIRVDVVRGLLQLGLCALVAFDIANLPLVVLCAFLLGCGDTFFESASLAVIPSLVSTVRSNLENANARMQTIRQTYRSFVGPAIGGVLFSLGRAVPAGVDGASYLASALILRKLPPIESPRGAERQRITAGQIVRDVWEGLVWLGQNRRLLVLFVVSGMSNLVFGADMAIFVLFVTRLLGMSAWEFGLLTAGAVAGSVVGSLAFTWLRRWFSLRLILFTALAARAVAFAAIGLMSSAILIWLMMSVVGLATVMWNIVSVSTRQAAVPTELRGRVLSAFRCVIAGSVAIGGLLGGLLADAVGLRAPYLIGGVIMLAVLAVAARPLSVLMREDEQTTES